MLMIHDTARPGPKAAAASISKILVGFFDPRLPSMSSSYPARVLTRMRLKMPGVAVVARAASQIVALGASSMV